MVHPINSIKRVIYIGYIAGTGKGIKLACVNRHYYLTNFTASFMAAAVNSLSAYDTPNEKKGRVSGYAQAGNMGGSGVGGGVGLWLAQHVSQIWVSGGALALICILCCGGLYFVKEPLSTIKVEAEITTWKNLFKDVWLTLKKSSAYWH